MWLKEILEKYNFSEEERALVHTHPREEDKSRVVADLILAKKIESAADRVIKSNEDVAKSNEKYSKAIVFLTLMLAMIELMNLFLDATPMVTTASSRTAKLLIALHTLQAALVVGMVVCTFVGVILGRPNRLSAVDRFVDSKCQSRFSDIRWRHIFHEKRCSQGGQLGATLIFTTL